MVLKLPSVIEKQVFKNICNRHIIMEQSLPVWVTWLSPDHTRKLSIWPWWVKVKRKCQIHCCETCVCLFFGVNLKNYSKISDLRQKICSSLPLSSVNTVPIIASRSSVTHLSSCLWNPPKSSLYMHNLSKQRKNSPVPLQLIMHDCSCLLESFWLCLATFPLGHRLRRLRG